MILDDKFSDYLVTCPFQIIRFCSLCDHHWDKN